LYYILKKDEGILTSKKANLNKFDLLGEEDN